MTNITDLNAIYQRPFHYNPPLCPLEVLHEDSQIIALNKPQGLLSVRGRIAEHQDSLEQRVQERWPEARIVHRLDMETSGLWPCGLAINSPLDAGGLASRPARAAQ